MAHQKTTHWVGVAAKRKMAEDSIARSTLWSYPFFQADPGKDHDVLQVATGKASRLACSTIKPFKMVTLRPAGCPTLFAREEIDGCSGTDRDTRSQAIPRSMHPKLLLRSAQANDQ